MLYFVRRSPWQTILSELCHPIFVESEDIDQNNGLQSLKRAIDVVIDKIPVKAKSFKSNQSLLNDKSSQSSASSQSYLPPLIPNHVKSSSSNISLPKSKKAKIHVHEDKEKFVTSDYSLSSLKKILNSRLSSNRELSENIIT